jgi:hypothetical protein
MRDARKKGPRMTLYTNDRLCVKLTPKGCRHLRREYRKITGGTVRLGKSGEHYTYTCSLNTFLIYFGGSGQAVRSRNEGLFIADQMEVL